MDLEKKFKKGDVVIVTSGSAKLCGVPDGTTATITGKVYDHTTIIFINGIYGKCVVFISDLIHYSPLMGELL